jgi:hypothetical protein
MMKMKKNKETLKLEGWFPPCIANTWSGRYACCGGQWEEIEDDVTIDDVMKAWTCTAPAWKPKEETAKVFKRPTKASLATKMATNDVVATEPVIRATRTPARPKAVKITFVNN